MGKSDESAGSERHFYCKIETTSIPTFHLHLKFLFFITSSVIYTTEQII